MRWPSRGVELKTPEQIDRMRRAGLVVAGALDAVRDAVRPGVSTAELDALAEDTIRSAGAVPSFLGYQGFPRAICTSVNDEIVHGIPGDRVLAQGDLISIDCGAVLDGWHGDAAVSVPVGAVTSEIVALVETTHDALWDAIVAAGRGGRVRDISVAVESRVGRAGGYGIVREYVGHGIGTRMHQPPDVPNVPRRRRGPRLVEGLVVAIEPMLTLGGAETELLDDDWTVVSADGSWAAHIEHTVALTPSGPWVLTAHDGGEAELTARGIAFGGR